jgi:hypothetical protein
MDESPADDNVTDGFAVNSQRLAVSTAVPSLASTKAQSSTVAISETGVIPIPTRKNLDGPKLLRLSPKV